MVKRFLELTNCPACGNRPLSLSIYRHESDEIIDGMLTCEKCNEWYPIIAGVPRMLFGSLKLELVLEKHADFLKTHGRQIPANARAEWEAVKGNRAVKEESLKLRTAESFAYEWNIFHRMFDMYRQNFLNYISPLKESFFVNKLVLDVGCGVGRHAYWAAKFGAEVVALDLGDAVEATYRNCRDLRVHVVQADILHPPFKNVFDYVFSIGVLHHLPDPEAGFRALVPLVKRGGKISIWVYGRRNNFSNVYVYEALRRVTRRIPHKVLYYLCYIPAVGVEALNGMYRFLRRLSPTRAISEKMPFRYYAQFPFEVKVNDAFDVFATPRNTYWLEEQIKSWFQRAGILRPDIALLRKKSIIAHGTIE